MRQYDLSPLYRSTVGFDRLFSLLDQMSGVDATAQSYPPYNIERTGENAYRISVAVAGFAEKDLAIETRENTLLIRGSKSAAEGDAPKHEVLYQGIAARAFERHSSTACSMSSSSARSRRPPSLARSRSASAVPRSSRPRSSPSRPPEQLPI